MEYQDYYKTLGVDRNASHEEIQKAYRKLARQYHPDMNKDKGAEARFKQVNEANDVLGDREKRKRYDALGANWKAGQNFTPPPGFESIFGAHPGGGGFGGGSGFSSFFDTLFGSAAGGGQHCGGAHCGGGRGGSFNLGDDLGAAFNFGGGQGHSGSMFDRNGKDIEAPVTITVEDAFHGARKSITIETPGHQGQAPQTRTIQVQIPAGTTEGKVIRLAGQGQKGVQGGRDGALLLKVKIASHPRFTVKNYDVNMTVPVAPWEAALGAKVRLETMDGFVTMNIPAGSQSGQKLRMKGKGLPRKGGDRGDLFAEIKIAVPKELTPEETELFERLSEVSDFSPRDED